MVKKLFSYVLSFVTCFCLLLPTNNLALADEHDERLRIEVDGIVFASYDYSPEDYYYTVVKNGNNHVIEIFKNGEDVCLERITLLPEEVIDVPTRSGTYIQRAYRHQKYGQVLNRNICGAENEVLLYIYSYGSFQQIESVLSNRVYSTSGISAFSISGSTCSAISPTNSFPTASVDCYYSATCTGSLNVQTTMGLTIGIGSDYFSDADFTVESTLGTTLYFTKNLHASWNISVA